MRPMRAPGLSTSGMYWCGGCQGSGRATYRNWGRGGWTTVSGRCPMCSGVGGRIQNHEPRGAGKPEHHRWGKR